MLLFISDTLHEILHISFNVHFFSVLIRNVLSLMGRKFTASVKNSNVSRGMISALHDITSHLQLSEFNAVQIVSIRQSLSTTHIYILHLSLSLSLSGSLFYTRAFLFHTHKTHNYHHSRSSLSHSPTAASVLSNEHRDFIPCVSKREGLKQNHKNLQYRQWVWWETGWGGIIYLYWL